MAGLFAGVRAVVFDAYGTLFDTNSVVGTLEAECPGQGEYLTNVWRLKQLEYSWLRGLSGDYADFSTVTRDALRYSLDTLGLASGPERIARLASSYDRLALFPDSRGCLASLASSASRRVAVFSNGSPAMLAALVGQAGLTGAFEALISVDPGPHLQAEPGRLSGRVRHAGPAPGADPACVLQRLRRAGGFVVRPAGWRGSTACRPRRCGRRSRT